MVNAVDGSGRSIQMANRLNSSLCIFDLPIYLQQARDCSCHLDSWARDLCKKGMRGLECALAPTTPSSETAFTDELYRYWSGEVVNQARSEIPCLMDTLQGEIGSLPGANVQLQARVITWAVLNRLAVTKELDVARHGNNLSVKWCNIQSAAVRQTADGTRIPCNPSASVQNPQIEAGMQDALDSYLYRSTVDPTDGSLEWRHYPQDGSEKRLGAACNNGTGNLEAVSDFYSRFLNGAQGYEDRNPNRIAYPQHASEDEISNYSTLFNATLCRLGKLSVFNRFNTQEGANITEVLNRPIAGYVTRGDSCSS
jgi:hypothetical protein